MEKDIKLKGIIKKFEGREVLREINLEIKKAEIFAILGISGAGKTTLLRIISGLEIPDKGRVYINGKLATDGGKIIIPPYKRKIGFIFQNLGLWEHLTVEEHIKFVTSNKQKIEEILKFFDLAEHRKKKPYQLSGGERQRLAIARSFAQEPEFLLLDEPFSNLDVIKKRQMRTEILKIKENKNIGVIYVTHDPLDIKIIADRIAILHNGKIIQIGKYKEILSNPAEPIVKDLLQIIN